MTDPHLDPSLPTVSVVVPVRDDAERLRGCLASVHTNRYGGHFEIIVVDNGSSDHSVEVARDAGAHVLSLPGHSVATLRNAGANHASGGILAFVDADHVIDEQWIESAVDVLRDPGTAAVGALCFPPPDFNWVQRAYDRFRSHPQGIHDVEWLGSGNLAVRRDAFLEVGGFDTSLETCEDVDLCNRLRAAGHRIVSDDRMRSVHLGDPSTLRALFYGELWRGRDNLRATLRGPVTVRSLPSLAIPVVDLLLVTVAVVGAGTTRWLGPAPLVFGTAGILLLALCRAARMTLNTERVTLRDFAPNLAVACVYDMARALALISGTTHDRRRVNERSKERPQRM